MTGDPVNHPPHYTSHPSGVECIQVAGDRAARGPAMTGCPGRLALCGVPCGCDGDQPSHYPADDLPAFVPPLRADPYTTADMLELHLRLTLDDKENADVQ